MAMNLADVMEAKYNLHYFGWQVCTWRGKPMECPVCMLGLNCDEARSVYLCLDCKIEWTMLSLQSFEPRSTPIAEILDSLLQERIPIADVPERPHQFWGGDLREAFT